jgi:hypothetical protein
VDVDLERLDRRRGRCVSPEPVHQPVARHDGTAGEQERREQGALLRRAERDRAGVDDGLDRPKDAKLDWRCRTPFLAAARILGSGAALARVKRHRIRILEKAAKSELFPAPVF